MSCLALTGCSLNHAVKFYRSQTETNSEWKTEHHVTTLPFRLVDEKILVPLSINGSKPLKFVLDTGSPVTVVVESLSTTDLNLSSDGKGSAGGLGDGERLNVYYVHDIDIGIGDLTIIGKSIISIPLSELPFFDELGEVFFDGIIGYNLLADFIVEINYDDSMITLYDKGEYGDAKYDETEWLSAPLSIEGFVPYIESRVQLSENSEPLDLKLILDTGAGGTVALSPKTHEGIVVPDKYYTSIAQGLSGDVKNHHSFIKSATLGNTTFNNLLSAFSDGAVVDAKLEQLEYHGSVGNGLLSKFNVVFNYQDQYMLLQKNHRFDTLIQADRSGLGMTVLVNNKGYAVKLVIEDTASEKFGLKPGDVIHSFNNLPASQENAEKFRRMLASDAEYVDLCWISSNQHKCDKLVLEDRIKTHSK